MFILLLIISMQKCDDRDDEMARQARVRSLVPGLGKTRLDHGPGRWPKISESTAALKETTSIHAYYRVRDRFMYLSIL